MPSRLLFGAPIVVLSSARLTPSSDLASASNSATRRIAERAKEPAAAALSLAAALLDATRDAGRIDWVLKWGHPPEFCGRRTVVRATPPVQRTVARRQRR